MKSISFEFDKKTYTFPIRQNAFVIFAINLSVLLYSLIIPHFFCCILKKKGVIFSILIYCFFKIFEELKRVCIL